VLLMFTRIPMLYEWFKVEQSQTSPLWILGSGAGVSEGLDLTYLLAYGGAFIALFSPLFGLCVYVAFSVARPQLLYGWAGDMSGLSRSSAWRYWGLGRSRRLDNGRCARLAFPSLRCAVISRACCCPPRSRATRRSRGSP
jgi:hypothetical protein